MNHSYPRTRRSFIALGMIAVCFCGFISQANAKDETVHRVQEGNRIKHIRVNREVTWSMLDNLITLGEIGVAESVLQEHLKVDPLDGKSWLFMSQVQVRQGKHDEAKKSLSRAKRALAGSENDMLEYAQAEYSLGKGNQREALRLFKGVASRGGPLSSKAARSSEILEKEMASGRKIASLQQVPGLLEAKSISEVKKAAPKETEVEKTSSAPWSASANLSLLTGYDANILQIADSIVPSASNLGSAYSTVGVQGVVSGGALGGLLSISGSAGYTKNMNSLASGLNNLNLSNGIQWGTSPSEKSRAAFMMTATTAASLMESNSYGLYFWSSSVQPTLAYRLTERLNMDLSVSGGVNRFPGVEVTSSQDDRAGSQFGSTVGFRGQIGQGTLGSNIGYTQQKSNGANFRTRAFSLGLTGGHPLNFLQSSLNSTFSFASTAYPESDSLRSDKTYSASVGWDVPVALFGQKLNASSSLGWSHVASTDDSATFSKVFLNLQVVYAIK